jgi:rhodanese-related sulfurtransferase
VDVPEVDIDELARRRQAGEIVLIDVREPEEYIEGHVPEARLIPLGDVPDRLAEVPSGPAVLVICKSGGRSLRAAEYLRANGVDAINVAGGTSAWIDAGQPIERGGAS